MHKMIQRASLLLVAFALVGQAQAQVIDPENLVLTDLSAVNAALTAQGLGVQIEKVEYLVDPEADGEIQGRTIFADDRELRLDTQWAPSDARRLADGDNITYLIDPFFVVANGSIDSEPAIDASFATWNNVNCSNLSIVKRPFAGIEPNFVLGLFFGFPADPFQADITTTGFLPGFVFDIIEPGGSNFILGVTWTLIFVDGAGDPTDIDGDGNADVALKEVWYNDAFAWDTSGGNIDIETVGLHENGHALGLAHFGSIFQTSNGKIHFAPHAVMNAAYSGPQRSPRGTDNGAYCGIYASWP